ncbi:MAG: hypothetical protein ABI572_07210 [Actinomycetota bacterium]
MEVDTSASPDLKVSLDRIEAAVSSGDTDLRTLGFWRVVARVKPDRMLVDEHADQIGRIDTAAFRSGVKFRIPVWAGNLILTVGTVVGGVAAWLAYNWTSPLWKGLALVAAGAIWAVTVHSPAHWLVGRAIGLRFTDYFLGGPPPPRPGLKTAYATYLRADPSSRAWMHASGAIATKLAPFVALALWPGSGAPWWSALGLLALGVVQIVTDVVLSTKSSDWKKFAREKAVARSREP